MPNLQQAHIKPSASDSLHRHLRKDIELSLVRSGSKHSTWRDSVNGLARSVLLKAKDSIDTLRGAPDESAPADSSNPYSECRPPTRSHSSAHASIRSEVKARSKEAHEQSAHASLSLRRVLTSSSRHSKRSPLLLNLIAKRSVTKLQGPEALFEDVSESSSMKSAAASLRSLRLNDSPKSQSSSARTSKFIRPLERISKDYDSVQRPSSPIPIRKSSPPPSINFEIESGELSPTGLLGLTVRPSPPMLVSTPAPPAIPEFDVATRDTLIVSRRRSKRHIVKDEFEKLKERPVPRRSSNDHWRLRRLSHRRQPHPIIPLTDAAHTPPSPMPGTNLPLDDPFDAHTFVPSGASTEDTMHQSQFGQDGADDNALGNVRSKNAREHSSLEKIRRQEKNDLTSLSIEELRAQLLADRKALETLEHRMAGIELKLRRESPERGATAGLPTLTQGYKRRLREVDRTVSGTSHESASSATGQVSFRNEDESNVSLQSPLEVQNLFYPSDHSQNDDSFTSEANQYLRDLQDLATNGGRSCCPVSDGDSGAPHRVLEDEPITSTLCTPHNKVLCSIKEHSGHSPKDKSPTLSTMESPTMGDAKQIRTQRQERAQRYRDLFSVNWDPGVGPVDPPFSNASSVTVADDDEAVYLPDDTQPGAAWNVAPPNQQSWVLEIEPVQQSSQADSPATLLCPEPNVLAQMTDSPPIPPSTENDTQASSSSITSSSNQEIRSLAISGDTKRENAAAYASMAL